MPVTDTIVRMLRQLGYAITGRRFIEVAEEGPNRLVLETNRGTFVFDQRRGVAARDGKQIARFKDIKFIDIIRDKEIDEHTHWEVKLYLNVLHRIRVGETLDDAQASIVGARLVEITGSKLLAWKESHDLKR